MSEFYQLFQKKPEEISSDHAFRILNTFINHPCTKYAKRLLKVLPQIRAYVQYYEGMLQARKIDANQKGIVLTFILEYYHALELLRPIMEDVQKAEMEALPVC